MSQEERDAFIAGVAFGDFMSEGGTNWTDAYKAKLEAEAARRYPDPAPAQDAKGAPKEEIRLPSPVEIPVNCICHWSMDGYRWDDPKCKVHHPPKEAKRWRCRGCDFYFDTLQDVRMDITGRWHWRDDLWCGPVVELPEGGTL